MERCSANRAAAPCRSAGWQPAVSPTASRQGSNVPVALSPHFCYPAVMEDGETPNPGLERTKFYLRSTGIPEYPPAPLRSGIHTRGYLPHVKREGASYFVTF